MLRNGILAIPRHFIGFAFLIIGQVEHHVGQPFLEGWIVLELFEKFHIICHDRENDLLQGPFALSPGFLFIRVLHSIAVLLIVGNHDWDTQKLLLYVIGIVPLDIPEHVIEF